MWVQIISFTALWKAAVIHLSSNMQKLGHDMKIGLGMEIVGGKNQWCALIKIDNKTHFILGPNSYMFRHQCAILRGFIKKKDYKYNLYWGAVAYPGIFFFGGGQQIKLRTKDRTGI